MNSWAVFSATGKIEQVYSGPESEAMQQASADRQVIPISPDLDDSTAYVLNGAITAKQPFSLHLDKPQIVADGNDLATIGNVPAGTTLVWHDGQVDEINDGTVQIDTDLPGTYTLTFTAIPYLDQEVVIEAVAAA